MGYILTVFLTVAKIGYKNELHVLVPEIDWLNSLMQSLAKKSD